MSEALFLRLLPYEDKSTALTKAIAAINDNHIINSLVYVVNSTSFNQVPGSPFAYWVSSSMRKLFITLPPLDGEGRAIRAGLQTSNDFRFVRTWWEVASKKIVTGTPSTTQDEYRRQTFEGRDWVPFAKGGAYSPYYSDLHLVVNWERDGEEMKNWAGSLYNGSHWSRIIKNVDFYFCPGLTWSDRTSRLFSARPLPAGSIFSVKGSAGFFTGEELYALGIMNSLIFNGFLSLLVGAGDAAARSYQVGVIGSVPFLTHSSINNQDYELLKKLTYTATNLKRSLDSANETSHMFLLPAVLQITSDTLVERINIWQKQMAEIEQQLDELQSKIDNITFHLYHIEDSDRHTIEELLGSNKQVIDEKVEEDDAEENASSEARLDAHSLVTDLLSYSIGCALGRWDVRISLNSSLTPKLPGPLHPLPVCAPGMLIGPDGLPATQDHIVSEEWLPTRPDAITLPPEGTAQQPTIQGTQYPITVAWDGILVDDMDHSADIVRRVREVLAALWPSEDGMESEAIDREAGKILGVKDLREYFRRQVGFFAHHLKRYSNSRRQAPIYWPLSTASGSYTLWIYYHRLTSDTLFTAVNQYVDPKITEIQRRIGELEGRLTRTTGREATQVRGEIEDARALLAELQNFRAELLRVAALPYRPDLNDGVILNAAPLHRLFRFPKWAKDTKECWGKLQRGEYDWAHLAYSIWPDRVREKCRADRSLAIAHDLEHLYIERPTIAQRKRSRKAVPDKEDEE
jgi:hypothetical protein